MTNYVTGSTIRTLRESKGYTQKQLAEQLLVSDKTVSKWETQKGLPDITLIEPLAQALGVSVAELLSGDCRINRNRSANLLRGHFYACPICGNAIYAAGEGAFSCCGVTLPPLETEEADAAHTLHVEQIEHEYYLSMEHPMSKTHYISFFAYVTSGRMQLLKLYPEQNPEGRFPMSGHGMLYAYCNRHGLLGVRI